MTDSVGPRIPQFGERQRERLAKLLRTLGRDNTHEAGAARAAIDRLLKQHEKKWSDLVELLGGKPASICADLLHNLADLGSDDSEAYAQARANIEKLLAQNYKSWNDLVDQLGSLTPELWVTSAGLPDPELDPDLLLLLIGAIKDYVDLEPHEYITVALWILHTHCYRNFMQSPRLVLRSPVAGCGKTVLLDIMVRLVARADKLDALTTASLYHLIDETHPTLLLDEADNLCLMLQANGPLRAVLNAGHRYGATKSMQDHGETRKFSIYAPVALALPDAMGGLSRCELSESYQ